ncbi:MULTISPECIES: HD family phosphohydrolase [unclassified Cyanobium]|uniref:HD family phosphohydrolase n=1 Tax=unclassified Cyanobium TaxID=2627006 RepID=UPI0020CD8167|nr:MULTISPECIES: HD family phosphohydrolase [unclassified Cyanobium]MCP9860093.1 GAF domain-containing protein [Cyanobium sp. Cruz-8H5]MCP9867313.1 GAF domain-containing protein [Cyanobium sp. Cruz-8D1]
MLQIATAISGAASLPALLRQILSSARDLTLSDAGSIYLVEEDKGEKRLWFTAFQNSTLAARGAGIDSDLLGVRFPITPERLVGWTALHGKVLNLPDVYAIPPDRPYHFDAGLDHRTGYRAVSMLVVPLRTMAGDVVGVMQLINRKREAAAVLTPETAAALVRPFDAGDQQLIEALAALAAVCVERTQALEGQQRQIDSMIALLAGAIDARSSHTGRHCSRVPELALLLAEAAEATEVGPLAPFRFSSEAERREFRTAAWLHDCGKPMTPEAVVEKATKLDAPCNRIHEIRTRFEVLLRDGRIALLEGLLAGGDPETLQRDYAQLEQELRLDFACVARCNLGSEGTDPDDLAQLQRLAGRRWWRHFDDRLGLGWEEQVRYGVPLQPLPAPETLLSDAPHHRLPRPAADVPESSWGFNLTVPELLYNRGELSNLSVARGTLTGEEIDKIREHMIHTIVMLESMAFPPSMGRVAEIAGGHHETLDGRGYPRGLTAEQLSIPARILAIADIFEALTAPDRPYKQGMPLSQSLKILAGLRDRGRIDADLFDLFLRSGVYITYAQRFLAVDQIDAVDLDALLKPGAQASSGSRADGQP